MNLNPIPVGASEKRCGLMFSCSAKMTEDDPSGWHHASLRSAVSPAKSFDDLLSRQRGLHVRSLRSILGLVRLCACLMLLAATGNVARADLRLSALFSDHAVLQRDRPLPVWGWATPGEKVSVQLGKETAEAITGIDGRWQVVLKPQPVSTSPMTLTVNGKNTITVKDIVLGDVWLCSGQSNMEFVLGGCTAPKGIS